jgi:hypothetical protein
MECDSSLIKNIIKGWVQNLTFYNPSHLGGVDLKNCSLRQAQAKS